MIVVHGETLWSPAPQPMDDDDEPGDRRFESMYFLCVQGTQQMQNLYNVQQYISCMHDICEILGSNPGMLCVFKGPQRQILFTIQQ